MPNDRKYDSFRWVDPFRLTYLAEETQKSQYYCRFAYSTIRKISYRKRKDQLKTIKHIIINFRINSLANILWFMIPNSV